MEQKQIVGSINIKTDLNDYAIKCKIYNKITKMGLATYKNTWTQNNANVFILDLNWFTIELQNKTIILYSNTELVYNSNQFKCLTYILHELA
jgi:hypothetical protein